jgi:isopenicillin N synthase-like dioxygenase
LADVGGLAPLIDLTAAPEADRRREVADRIGVACEQLGFFLIAGHGVPNDLVERMDAVTREFLRSPAADKRYVAATADDPLRHGWEAVGTSRTAASRGIETPPDLVEMFKISRPTGPMGDQNRWPRSPSDFRATWSEYYDTMTSLMHELLRLSALALGLPEQWFDDKIDNHNATLAANYYPPQPDAPLPGQYRCGPHSDFGLVTILYRDDASGGLEVQDNAGAWHAVPVVPGTFVVNIGDMMAVLTGGRWVSSVHRAVNPPRMLADTDRISIPFFGKPNLDMRVEPISSTSPANPSAPTAYEFLQRRIRATYDS